MYITFLFMHICLGVTPGSTDSTTTGGADDSLIMILFGIVNLVLIVMLILVCIFAPRVKQKEPTTNR